jgi:hypothetical protein
MPTNPASRTDRKTRSASKKAFLNIPYDKEFEPLYLAFIAGLAGFGLIPQAVLQIPESQRRLDRILSLIRSCKISFHDLSRVELDLKRPHTPRFNMPFELGLAVAWQRVGDHSHHWYVFEAKAHRLQKSLSDLNGTDPNVHYRHARGVLQQLANVLVRQRHRPTVQELEAILRELQRAAAEIKNELRTKSLFTARGFEDLVLAAGEIARSHVTSLRPKGR